MTGKTHCKCMQSSLFSQSIHKVVTHLDLYSARDIELLPINIKNLILRRVLCTTNYARNPKYTGCFSKILDALLHRDVQKLNFTGIPVSDEMLDIISKCENLKVITLDDTGTFTKIGLLNLLEKLRNICSISIQDCSIVDNEVMACIASNCPLLTSLDIGGSLNVDDAGVAHLATLSHLKWVSFSKTKATHEGISTFVEGKSAKNLLEFRIDNCPYVTEATLKKIADSCPNLQILIFYNCSPCTAKVETFSNFEDTQLKNLKQITWTINW